MVPSKFDDSYKVADCTLNFNRLHQTTSMDHNSCIHRMRTIHLDILVLYNLLGNTSRTLDKALRNQSFSQLDQVIITTNTTPIHPMFHVRRHFISDTCTSSTFRAYIFAQNASNLSSKSSIIASSALAILHVEQKCSVNKTPDIT